MHLLAANSGEIQQEGEAISLGQSPGNIIFVSSADSELALMAGGVDRAGVSDVRLANILTLAHNFSVDMWLEETVRHADLVVVRLGYSPGLSGRQILGFVGNLLQQLPHSKDSG